MSFLAILLQLLLTPVAVENNFPVSDSDGVTTTNEVGGVKGGETNNGDFIILTDGHP